MKNSFHQFIRMSHRYLGVFIGVQFLAWVIGGLYFSWTNIEEIRGNTLRKAPSSLVIPSLTISLGKLIDQLQAVRTIDKLTKIQVIDILGKSYYQVHYLSGNKSKVLLADVRTGAIRPPLTRQEAIEVAQQELKYFSQVINVEYLTETDGHHEYREKPLPAYAITFDKPNPTTVYVATELGTVQSLRSNAWRIFDWFWMLHTMDYATRDNINNWVLRIFSLLGLLTVLSGFALFFLQIVVKKRNYFWGKNDKYAAD